MKALTKEFNNIADQYVHSVLDLWGINNDEYPVIYWVGDDKGGVVEIADIFIDFSELRYIFDNNISCGEYLEYYEYHNRLARLNMERGRMNLKSWHLGAPRISEEEFIRLEAAQQAIKDLQEDLEKQIKQGAY